MEFKNRIINDRIRKWTSNLPESYNVFHKYRIIIKVADELSEVYKLSNEDLARIVDGVLFFYLSIKKGSRNRGLYIRTANSNLKLLFDPLIKHINSDSYKEYIIKQQISEEDILKINNILVKITAKALLLHSKKTGKPLVNIEAAEELEKDFIIKKSQFYKELGTAETIDKSLNVREINIENLFPYFTSIFKGKGNGNIDYFTILTNELKNNRTTLEFAQIAYLIYKSKFFNKREFNSFSKWLRFFCSQIDVNYVNYKPNRVNNPSDSLLKIFNYLHL